MSNTDNKPRLRSRVESIFALWRDSLRPGFGFALLYSLAGCLPAFSMGELPALALASLRDLSLFAMDPFAARAEPDVSALLAALAAWLAAPATWWVLAASALLALLAVTALMLRQHDIELGRERDAAAVLSSALARLPAALAAWAGYFVLMLVATLPIAALAWAVLAMVADVGVTGLILLLLVFIAGSVVLSIPLAWASVAFAVAPVASTLAGTSPMAAQLESTRLVRGHWLRAATLLTVPLLIYLGGSSVVSSAATLAVAGTAWLAGGSDAVLSGGWIAWMQLLAAVPMALLVPLPFAGMVVTWEDLRALNGIQRSG